MLGDGERRGGRLGLRCTGERVGCVERLGAVVVDGYGRLIGF